MCGDIGKCHGICVGGRGSKILINSDVTFLAFSARVSRERREGAGSNSGAKLSI